MDKDSPSGQSSPTAVKKLLWQCVEHPRDVQYFSLTHHNERPLDSVADIFSVNVSQ